MPENLLERVDTFIAKNKRNIVNDIAALVAVRSEGGSPAPTAPFGAGPRAALDASLATAKRLGLATNTGDGYVGWAEVPGTQTEHLATITHVDIVPAGDGWGGDAFALREVDGWLLGRGVLDDKGPTILCLYAAHFLQQHLGTPLRYGLRVLIGCSEERGMDDVPYYLAHNKEPLFCFSPDAEFPLCNGEKGIFEGVFISPSLEDTKSSIDTATPANAGSSSTQHTIVEFEGGIASNVIPHKAHCVLRTQKALPQSSRVRPSPAGEGLVRLEAFGIGGHAASPAGTINAIGLLVDYILAQNLCTGTEYDFLLLLQKLHSHTNGSGLGIACEEENAAFTPLSAIGGTIQFKNGTLQQSINVRYPPATTGAAIAGTLSTLAGQHGATFCKTHDAKPFYISTENPAIQTLLSTYSAVTHKAARPFTIGGGTYARLFQNAVSYGPYTGEQRPPFAGPEHAANEGIRLQSLLDALKIYILALVRLQNVDFV